MVGEGDERETRKQRQSAINSRGKREIKRNESEQEIKSLEEANGLKEGEREKKMKKSDR